MFMKPAGFGMLHLTQWPSTCVQYCTSDIQTVNENIGSSMVTLVSWPFLMLL